MDHLRLLVRRWGNDGAVANARNELLGAHESEVAASVVARRVEHRVSAQVAVSPFPVGVRAA